MTKRVVISNVYGDDNRGGAAITAATIESVRRALPGCQVTLIAVNDSAVDLPRTHRHTRARFPDVELLPAIVKMPPGPLAGVRAVLQSLLLLWRAPHTNNTGIQRIRNADMVVGKGGQVFSGARSFRDLGGFWLTLFPLLVARRLGLPTALYSITVGPYPRPTAARALAAWVLRRIDLILVRDRRSYEQALRLRVADRRVQQIPDCVLGVTPPTQRAVETISQRQGLADAPFGAVTVATSGGAGDEYLLTLLATTLQELLDRAVVQRILVVLQTDGKVTTDRVESKALVERMADARVTLVDEDLPPDELMALYGAAAFTLGCRVHSAIFSAVAGTPAFPLSRAANIKAESIFETLGLGDYVVLLGSPQTRPPNLAVDVAAAVEKAVARGAEARAEIRAAVADQAANHERGVQALARLSR